MENPKNQHCRKNEYQKIGFDLKLSIIDQVTNGQISIYHASKLHEISRSSIFYRIKKLRTFDRNSRTISKNQELNKLKKRIEELEFIKDFLQMVIAEIEVTTGIDFVKKVYARNIDRRNREKEKRPFKVSTFYECFGITKHAYYKRIKFEKLKRKQVQINLELIKPIRENQTKYGGSRMYLDLQDELKKNNIKMGRDAFFTFLRNYRFLVKKTKRYHVTTDSKHGFFKSPNRLKDHTPSYVEQVWVSDITYVKIQKNHSYLALVTDVYSKKIMGYKIDTNMKATLVKEALQLALKNRLYSHQNIIHHR